jgi:2',3'-cyclic-nucleotide 2'-phosphodiesterase (5'-nucleotidase family)
MKMVHIPKYLFFIFLGFCFITCNTGYKVTKNEYNKTQISYALDPELQIQKIIQPYKDSLDKEMNVIIGYCKVKLLKEQPEGSLNNFLADAILENYGQANSIVVLNYGGIRMPVLPEGAITKRNVFELLPFDNKLVKVSIMGSQLLQLCNLIAQKKGWPIAGFVFEISNNKAINIFVNGNPLESNKMYQLITNDYLANGGDNCIMLSNLTQTDLNTTLRDAIINYIMKLNASSNKIIASKDGRILNTDNNQNK